MVAAFLHSFGVISFVCFLAVFEIPKSSAADCKTNANCQTCGKEAGCQWCSGNLKITILTVASDYYVFGVCVPRATSCTDVQFGDIAGLLDVTVAGKLELDWSVVAIPSTDEACTSYEWPKEVASPTCEECVELGAGYGWCDAEINASILSLPILELDGAFCIRESFAFLCDPGIIPKGPYHTVIAEMKYLTTKDQCTSKIPTPPPPPSATCGNNLSCDSCGKAVSDCTWCGMQSAEFAFTGRCVDGKDADCTKVSPGTVMELLSDFGVTVESITKDDDMCTTVQWPAVSWDNQDCGMCTGDPNAGWCLAGDIVDGGYGGLCLPADWNWICNNDNILEDTISLQWADDAGSCADITTPTPTPATTSASAPVRQVAVSSGALLAGLLLVAAFSF